MCWKEQGSKQGLATILDARKTYLYKINMDKTEKVLKRKLVEEADALRDESLPRSRTKNRGRKRKREDSETSTDLEDMLPDNALEVEKNLHASALKNNLDDESVKKILKKVVTNDHVLALVKIREQEEAATNPPEANAPKLTRAKAKELMKASPAGAPWNLELTPIKRIPVKTRPEVEALIAQELPEDEDDDEYEPNHDDVPSDDDQTLESCSDVDSQPRTPASATQPSPRVLHDGPFKVPQPTTPARRKLLIPEDEEATIALRTRSKINLSSTTIEHIESTFVPPDDVPPPRDEEWDQFLSGVFDPTGFREEDDPDETDPEYNVAADPDANEEDDLDGSILRISRKELSDLVTELFSIMPEAAAADELASDLAQDVLTDHHSQISGKWEGKQEPLSDEEQKGRPVKNHAKRDSTAKISIGKSEPEDLRTQGRVARKVLEDRDKDKAKEPEAPPIRIQPKRSTIVDVTLEERSVPVQPLVDRSPPPLLRGLKAQITTDRVEIRVDEASKIDLLPEQVSLLQQQLRQHVQLTASNFLQLFVNPMHWTLAPHYKQYLQQLEKMVESNPQSVVNVCNLRPALELVRSWEETVSKDTADNRSMVDFIQKEADRAHRRFKANSLYTGDFPDTFKEVVANSNVFLYPYLLPAMPYRIETYKKYGYRRSEDELISIGLDQFWQYIEDNPELYKFKQRPNPQTRVGLNATVTLVCKYMMPWMAPKLMLNHILRARKEKDNPLQLFFERREIVPVKHKLLPFNPELTLYQQPEHEMPRIWVRHLAKTSRRFKDYFYRRKNSGYPPLDGVLVDVGSKLEAPKKNPLPIDFTKTIISHRNNVLPKVPQPPTISDTYDIQIENVTGNVGNVEKDSNFDKQPNSIQQVNSQFITLDNSVINNHFKTNNVIAPSCIIPARKTDHDKVPENSKVPSSTEEKDKTASTKVQDTFEPVTNHTGAPFIAQNLYKVVETSTGSFLVPLTVVQTTNTVDSIKGPIPSAQEQSILSNDTPEPEKTRREQDSNHCKCCRMLNKICKEKQTRITDYFKAKIEKTCQCSDKKYPKVSKRLRMLVNNFKAKCWCVHRELQRRLNLSEKNNRSDDKNSDNMEADESEYDLEDIEFVTSYQMKLINRTNIARNNYTKKRVNNIFSKFDAEDGDVIRLTEELFEALEVDLVDLYQDFLGFLTAEQAEKIDKFRDYFTRRCVSDLMKEIEHQVTDLETKQQLLSRLSDIFFDATSSSCDMCCHLLDGVRQYPRLATRIFHLFPHRVGNRDRVKASCAKTKQPVSKRAVEESSSTNNAVQEEITMITDSREKEGLETAECDSSVSENETLTVIDYGDDHSDSWNLAPPMPQTPTLTIMASQATRQL